MTSTEAEPRRTLSDIPDTPEETQSDGPDTPEDTQSDTSDAAEETQSDTSDAPEETQSDTSDAAEGKLSDIPDLVEVPGSDQPTFHYDPPEGKEQAEKPDEGQRRKGDEEMVKKPEDDLTPAKLVRRADWGASRPRAIQALELPVGKVGVTYTETRECATDDECVSAVRHMQSEHMAEGEDDIRFNFLLGGNGVIYEGRGYTRAGPKYPPTAHELQQLNGQSINIAFIGKHENKPAKIVINALSSCLAEGASLDFVDPDFYTYYIVNNKLDYIQPPSAQQNPQPPPGRENTLP